MDFLFSGPLLTAALVTGSVYALIATGLNLIYGMMRLLNVAHGNLTMLATCTAFWFFTLFGIANNPKVKEAYLGL